MMLNLRQILTMHCREATRLASDEFDRPLTASEWLGMWAHLGICGNCRRLRRQFALIQMWVLRLISFDGPPLTAEPARLSRQRREQIKNALRNCHG